MSLHEHDLVEVTTIEDRYNGIQKYVCRYCNYKEERKTRVFPNCGEISDNKRNNYCVECSERFVKLELPNHVTDDGIISKINF